MKAISKPKVRRSRAPSLMPAPLLALRHAAMAMAMRGISIREWARRAQVPKSTLDHWLAPATRTADLAPLCRALATAGVEVRIWGAGESGGAVANWIGWTAAPAAADATR